jgi:hypothetical protein
MTSEKIRVTGHIGRVTSTWSVANVTKSTSGIIQPIAPKGKHAPAEASKKATS